MSLKTTTCIGSGGWVVAWMGMAMGILAPGAEAGQLTGSFARVPEGSVVDLTSEGKLDWVHWGLDTDSSLHRKSQSDAWIPDFEPLQAADTYTEIYRFDDHLNGFGWTDGALVRAVSDTPTGVWAYNFSPIGSGFALSVPADTTIRRLRLYVGAYAAAGRLTVSLSDGSAAGYQDTSLTNPSNGEGGVYTLEFAADSTNQTLQIEWALYSIRGATANVTLQAATLTVTDANNPPIVDLVSPAPYEQASSGSVFMLAADAVDLDGSIDEVEFYAGGNLVGRALSDPYTVTWSNAPPGLHTLTAIAMDDQGLTGLSPPVDVMVHVEGGSLAGQREPIPGSVDLTAEGLEDWVHLGLNDAGDLNRKQAGSGSMVAPDWLGSAPPQQLTDSPLSCSWSDGTPTVSADGVRAGVFQLGQDGEVAIALPADPTPRTVHVYAGLYGIEARLVATLSDASAPAFVEPSLFSVFGNPYYRFTLNYAAASPDQTLTIRIQTLRPFDFDFGSLALQALTLQQDTIVPLQPVHLENATQSEGFVYFEFQTASGAVYTVETADPPGPVIDWQAWTNYPGSGGRIAVSNEVGERTHRWYRVKGVRP